MATTEKKGTGRRYLPIGKNEIYDAEYDGQMLSSHIFNTDEQVNIHTILWTRENILGEINRYKGGEDGQYIRDGELNKAYIPLIHDKLKAIELKWEEYKIRCEREGYNVPEEMPLDLLNTKYVWEARLDVRTKELAELEKRLKVYTDADKAEEDYRMLQFGLLCSGQLRDSELVEIDDQPVVKVSIDDKRTILVIGAGPYKGLSVASYRGLAETWRKTMEEFDQKELLKVQEQARAMGKPIPSQPPCRAGQRVPRELLPPFPADAINYFQLQEQK